MSDQLLIFSNCTPYDAEVSLNDLNNPTVSLKPCLDKNESVPFSGNASWGAQQPGQNVLGLRDNLMVVRFSDPDGGLPIPDKTYNNLATPGYGDAAGPQPAPGVLMIWLFPNFILFSQNGKAQFQDFGTLPVAPGWQATPL